MFTRANLFILVLAIVSATAGLGLSLLLRAPTPAPSAAQAATMLGIGDLREDLALPDRNGTTRQLSEWDGKLVLLNFWASWCGPCREEMPLLDAARKRHAVRDLEVIGVAAEDAGPALAFLRDHDVSYPILINSPGDAIDVSLRFGNYRSVLPYNVLIARDGRIVATKLGNFDEAGLERWLAPHL
ncbi:MAG: TlpA disulfide reductase family protein [Dokdonella sp.]